MDKRGAYEWASRVCVLSGVHSSHNQSESSLTSKRGQEKLQHQNVWIGHPHASDSSFTYAAL